MSKKSRVAGINLSSSIPQVMAAAAPDFLHSEDPHAGEKALVELAPVMAMVDPAPYLPPRFSVPDAVAVVVQALPAIREHHTAIEAHSASAAEHLKRLEPAAMAVLLTTAELDAASDGATISVQRLTKEAREHLADLHGAATPLARAKLLDAEKIKEARGAQAPRAIAAQLLSMVTLFRDAWAHVQGKTTVTSAGLDAAHVVAMRLFVVTSESQQPQEPAQLAARKERRARALAVLLGSYDEIRRVLTFLRWHEDDVDRIAPSAFRKGRRHESKGAGLTSPTLAQPSA